MKSTWLQKKEELKRARIINTIEFLSVLVLIGICAFLLVAMYNYGQYTLELSLQ